MKSIFLIALVFLISCNGSDKNKDVQQSETDLLINSERLLSNEENFEKASKLLQENKAEEAKELYLTLTLQKKNQEEAFIGLGSAYLLLQEPDKGLKAFQDALQLRPNSFPALLGTGSACLTLGKFEQAKEYFYLANTNDATVPDSYWGLAIAYDGLNQKDSALFYANYFMDIDPNSPYIYDMQKIIKKHKKK